MGIDLGLKRVSRLLALLGDPHKSSWYAIHVAGTNGKGSVCAYLSSIFNNAKISSGRFTSPHLLERWDSISINGSAVKKGLFTEVEDIVRETNQSHDVGATEFELLTVTAFEIFRRERVRIAIVEVGLGGRLDATNALVENEDENETYGVIASVITKIGLDHQSFLGSTLSLIAKEKAGIIKPFIPVIVDGSNAPEVLEVVKRNAEENNSDLNIVVPQPTRTEGEYLIDTTNFGVIRSNITPLKGIYQAYNLGCAVAALSRVAHFFPELSRDQVIEGVKSTVWPGRLQSLSIRVNNKEVPILLDGAHNDEAADKLAQYIDSHVRANENESVTFVVAFTQGKNFESLLNRVLKPIDKVITTEFGNVDGMPWIKCFSAQELSQVCKTVVTSDVKETQNIQEAAELLDPNDKIVVFGSLYLASDLLKWQRDL